MTRIISNDALLSRIQAGSNSVKPIQTEGGHKDFKQVLGEVENAVKLSKHARERLETRNVSLTEQQMTSIAKAMDEARAKGVRDALIMMDGNCLVASVTNRTIVTAIKPSKEAANIITNIDAAIVL